MAWWEQESRDIPENRLEKHLWSLREHYKKESSRAKKLEAQLLKAQKLAIPRAGKVGDLEQRWRGAETNVRKLLKAIADVTNDPRRS